ncbi:MAG: hypothetical protein HOV87_22440 [Catenulispora sp.]|nr:hypothetical protein [Catenulispora sp.]
MSRHESPAGAGLIAVDWTSHDTPAAISLAHEVIRFMEEAVAQASPAMRRMSWA